MNRTLASTNRPAFASRAVIALAAITLGVHMIVNMLTPYGFQRDEFLYMAMGRHLQLWRMDFPPFIAIVSQLQRFALGDSLVAIRFAPSLAAALLVVLAALVARELGGGRFAQIFAAIAVITSPLFLRSASLFQPVIFDQLWWMLALYALARLCATAPRPDTLAESPRWWIVLGVACGLGLLTKFSLLFFGAGLTAGLLIAPQRRVLATPWPWMAAVIAFVIGSPSIVGQIRLGYPVVAQMKELQGSQLMHVSFWSFLTEQLLFGPVVLIALAGALYLVLAESMRPFRAIGWTCIGAFVILLALHGKSYYIGPIYPTLAAAGAVALERWSESPGRVWTTAVRAASVVLLVMFAVVGIPLELPILPPAQTAAFAARLGLTSATQTNRGMQLKLPQDYADMLGWPEEVAAVAHVYDSLPPEKRAHAVIVGENYGEAGALEFYGPRHGLPRAVSAAGSYWFFGPGEKPGAVIVTLGVSKDDLEKFYATVTPAGRWRNDWGVPEESDVPILVGENPRSTLQDLWPSLAGRN